MLEDGDDTPRCLIVVVVVAVIESETISFVGAVELVEGEEEEEGPLLLLCGGVKLSVQLRLLNRSDT